VVDGRLRRRRRMSGGVKRQAQERGRRSHAVLVSAPGGST
jgi:hypothetical protein